MIHNGKKAFARRLKVLIGCEESQAVCKAFRELGHEAYSCDLQPCSGGHPEWHIQDDIFRVMNSVKFSMGVDIGIFFPTCTYLTISANKWYKDQPERKSGVLVGEARREARREAISFFKALYNCGIDRVAIENPIGVMSTEFRKPDQVIQPYMFGHGETKATCLWLKNLPTLKHFKKTDLFNTATHVSGREQRLHYLPPSKERAKIRSKTFPGIASQMASQWSEYILNKTP